MKRSFDLICSVFGLILLMPVFLITAASVRLSSPGPIIYAQRRVGMNGRTFLLYKFRTMVDNADTLGSSVTTAYDRRVTKIGRSLRRLKLDELPQLWNVLKGDMSIVGPRPDVPEVVSLYSPDMLEILSIRPGITSIASLQFRDEEDMLALCPEPDVAYLHLFVPFKVRLGMEHVHRNSLAFDISVLLMTIWFVTFGRFSELPEHPDVHEFRLQLQRNINLK